VANIVRRTADKRRDNKDNKLPVSQDKENRQRNIYSDPKDLRGNLEALANDNSVPPAVRATAVRTLAEMAGLIGRHQEAPGRGQDKAVGALSRLELEQELERLRRLCAGQAAR
jgi:hypothetical protein